MKLQMLLLLLMLGFAFLASASAENAEAKLAFNDFVTGSSQAVHVYASGSQGCLPAGDQPNPCRDAKYNKYGCGMYQRNYECKCCNYQWGTVPK